MLPTVPENLSPGLKGRGTGLSGHDLMLVGSLLRAGMAQALQAGQDLACRPWAQSLLQGMGMLSWEHVLGKERQGSGGRTRAVGQGLCRAPGSWSVRFYSPGLGCIPTWRGCDTRTRHLALAPSSGCYSKHGEAGAKVRSPDTASSLLLACGHAKRCQLVPRLTHHTSHTAAGAWASSFVPAPVHGSAAASPRTVPSSSSSPWHLL